MPLWPLSIDVPLFWRKGSLQKMSCRQLKKWGHTDLIFVLRVRTDGKLDATKLKRFFAAVRGMSVINAELQSR
jgi:hypothetical protein